MLGFMASQQLKIGDLDPGAPELRADSRYNRDVAFVNGAYGASSDVLAVMVKTPDGACSAYDTLNKLDALEWRVRQLDGVESTQSLSLLNRRVLSGLNEGSPKWYAFLPNQDMLNTVTAGAPRLGFYDDSCSLLTLYIYLQDHKADTLTRVTDTVEAFAAENNTDDVKFLLAAGSAGIEAATNSVVRDAWRQMLILVYAAVSLLCLITFRSWRAVVVAVLPLMLTSLLAEALMVALGLGVKVATLPVIALGVGIGVDYALYILSVTLARLRAGDNLSDAYYKALLFTGKVVLLTGVTLAAGVITWVASPIKFQADMGLLLAFMFLWNMLGALILIPALAHFLLKPAAIERRIHRFSQCAAAAGTGCSLGLTPRPLHSSDPKQSMFKYFPTNYVWNLSVDLAIEMGARIGEIEAMCAPLQEAAKAPDKAGTQAFRETWVKMADQLCELADEDKARGRLLSAGEKINRAASYLITAERLQAHGSEGRVALYRRHLDLFAEGVRLSGEALRTRRDPLRRQTPVGAVCAGRGCQRPRAAAGAGQRPGLDQGDEIPRRPAGLAGQARRGLAGRRPAGHRRGAAAAGLHRPLRQRALGQPRRRLAGDARRCRRQAHRHGRRVARRLLLPARRGLRAAFCRRRGLGCQP